MGLIKEIIHWFVHGAPLSEATSPHAPSQEKQDKSKNDPQKRPLDLNFDLEKGVDVQAFVADLKSIDSISKQFSGAREDLLRELKSLSPTKKTGTDK